MASAAEIEMGSVENHVASNNLPGEERTEAVNLRRAVMVSFGTLVVLGLFIAYGSAAVAKDAAAEAYNTAHACLNDGAKQCVGTQAACPGDTRGTQGDVRCNHDSTHRVCAVIGDPNTSFWSFTSQTSWCGRDLYGNGQLACPYTADTSDAKDGSWCICKWATARWIHGVWPLGGTEVDGVPHMTCPDTININCAATDICVTHQGLFFSYNDYGVNLQPAHQCAKTRCQAQWAACETANPSWGCSGITATGQAACEAAAGCSWHTDNVCHEVGEVGTVHHADCTDFTEEIACGSVAAMTDAGGCLWHEAADGTDGACGAP